MLSSRAGTSSSTSPNPLGSRLHLKSTTRRSGCPPVHLFLSAPSGRGVVSDGESLVRLSLAPNSWLRQP